MSWASFAAMKYLLATTLLAATASARHHAEMNDWRSMGQLPGKDWQPVQSMGNATFKQLIDHKNPGLGTFEQFYYYDTTYWKGPGMYSRLSFGSVSALSFLCCNATFHGPIGLPSRNGFSRHVLEASGPLSALHLLHT